MSKKTLNSANLEALGAERLADLLMEVSAGSADIKRRLRFELVHNLGASELAHEVRKRLASLRKSKSYVGWRKRKAFIKDLDIQLSMITDKIAPNEPTLAFDLLWDFIEMAPPIYQRVDDSRGGVGEVFEQALERIEGIAPRAVLDPKTLADRVWLALQDNDYGQWDGVISLTADALGEVGLGLLRAHVEAHAEEPVEQDAQDHDAIRFLRQLRGGESYEADRKAAFVRDLLQEIAAVSGDTQAYIEQYSEADLKQPDIAAEVAQLWIEEGKAQDALELLEAADAFVSGAEKQTWDSAYLAALTSLGREDDAQTHRWNCFEANLNPAHLRSYLKGLPDFEDVEAEDKAKAYVLSYQNISTALEFCLQWPDLLTAAQLIQTRPREIDGDRYFQLAPAAEQLRGRYPLAATLLWRAMIDFALDHGRASRYGHVADHLADCVSVDGDITEYHGFEPHDIYLKKLEKRHERKIAFWEKVNA